MIQMCYYRVQINRVFPGWQNGILRFQSNYTVLQMPKEREWI